MLFCWQETVQEDTKKDFVLKINPLRKLPNFASVIMCSYHKLFKVVSLEKSSLETRFPFKHQNLHFLSEVFAWAQRTAKKNPVS